MNEPAFENWISPAPPPRGANCPPALALEALVAGEPARPELSAHLAECAACGGYARALAAEQEAYRKLHPPELFVAQVKRKASARPKHFDLRWVGLAAALTVAVLVVVVVPKGAGTGRSGPAVAFKGSPFSAVYLRAGMRAPAPVVEDLRVREGDALRFFYDAPKPGWLAILDLDSTGLPSVLYPYGGTRMMAVTAGDEAPLPRSIVMDSALGSEFFVAVWAPRRMALAPLLRALHGQAGKATVHLACPDCEVHVLRIQKVR